jgi:hypothetical protein
MNGPGPVDIVVDLTELDRTRAQLDSLIKALSDLPRDDRDGTDAETMGSADVAEAVGRFRSRWGEGADRILENLRSCLTYVENALQFYRGVEQALQAQLCVPDNDRSPTP